MDAPAAPSAATPWQRFAARVPMQTALAGVATVWVLGCVWSFHEQRDFAAAKYFTHPWLLPLVIDGMAAAMAGVAYAASLDGRAAVAARVATAVAVMASAASNATWASERSAADPATVTLAISVPVMANLAFEVLLSELRRQVQRRRGQPAPVAVPYPRMIRIALAPASTFAEWRKIVLEITAVREQVATPTVATTAALPPAATPQPPIAERTGRLAEARTAMLPGAALPELQSAGGAVNGTPTAAAVADNRMPTTAAAAISGAPTAGSATNGTAHSGSGRPGDARAGSHAEPTTARAATAPSAAPAAVERRTLPVSAPVRPRTVAADTGSRPAGSDTGPADDRVRRVVDLLAGGHTLTGDTVAELFGCSARTGRRLLRQGLELLAGDPTDPRPDDQRPTNWAGSAPTNA